MQKVESHDAGASGLSASPLNHELPSGGLQPSAKLLEKLAKWRLDEASVEFIKDAPEFRGGNATVVKGFLTSPSGGEDQKDQSDVTQGKSLDPNGPEEVTSRWSKPSTKLRDKLKKFSKWRIDKSSVEFPKDASESRSGNPTVVKGVSATPSGSEDQKDQSDVTQGKGLDSNGPEEVTSRWLKPVAVKKMNISDDRAKILGLTLREAGFLVDLSHTNVIKLEGFVEDLSKDIIWLVFPWEDNGTLRDFIASGDWEIPERILLIYDVAQGVEYLHSRTPPIRHGDLKSINILVNSKCHAVITDFGSARRLVAKNTDNLKETSQTENIPQAALSLEATFCSSTNTMGITLTGDKYTLRWAPPEVLKEEEACLESDIWALGWVAYEVMTNSIPFQDVVKDSIVIKRVVQGDLPSITDHARMSLIQALCSLMLACWNIDPRKRPTAEDCRKSLHWMPMIIPNPIRTTEAAALQARSPALLLELGYMHKQQDDYANALDFYTGALDSYRDIGDKGGESAALLGLAEVHRFLVEYNQAETFYSEALHICIDIGVSKGRADALFGLGEVHRQRKEHSQAVTFFSEALQIHTDIGSRQWRAYDLLGLAEVHRTRKEYSQAVTFYSDALQIQTDLGNRRGRAETLRRLGEIHRLQNQYSQAITFNSEALSIATDLGDRNGRAYALWNLADVHRDQGNFGDAVGPYTQAAEIFQQIGLTKDAAYASQQAAKVRRLSKREEVA